MPGDLRERLGLAVAAGEGVDERLVRQVLDRQLACVRRDRVGLAGDLDDRVVAEGGGARRQDQPLAAILEHVQVTVTGDRRLDLPPLADDAMTPDGVGPNEHDRRCRRRRVVAKLTADAEEHARFQNDRDSAADRRITARLTIMTRQTSRRRW